MIYKLFRILILFGLILSESFAYEIEPSFDDPILDTNYVRKIHLTNGLDTNETYSGKTFMEILDHIKLIFPGTLWCGAGTRAKNNAELGQYAKTDNCCRNHDNCDNIILIGETKFGLKNNGKFTRSNCKCDEQFYNCLKKSATTLSKAIGKTYFNILQPQCFKLEHPSKCLKILSGRCVQYTYDKMKLKQYQWFDNIEY